MVSKLEKPLVILYPTNYCMLDCAYCGRVAIDQSELDAEIAKDLIVNVIGAARSEGYARIKFSGRYGEPLLRDDLEELIQEAVKQQYEDISLSTNGLLLKARASSLRDAGLHRMCISLDTLSATKFKEITKRDAFGQVVEGIELAAKLFPGNVKLNVVVLRDLNVSEIDEIIRWAFERKVSPQFIEVVGSPLVSIFEKYFFSLNDVASRLAENARLVSYDRLDKRTTIVLQDGTVELRTCNRWPEQHYTWERTVVHPDGHLGIFCNDRTGISINGGKKNEISDALRALKQVKISKEQIEHAAAYGCRACVS